MTNFEQQGLFQSEASSPGDSPVKTSRWRDAARAWVAHARGCSGRSCGWPGNCAHGGSFLRTSPASCRPSAPAQEMTPASPQAALFDADDGRSETESVCGSLTSRTPPKAVPASQAAWSGMGVPWVPFSGRWLDSGMGTPTECWTLSTSESPSDASGSSLQDVLETGPHLSRYFLSPKAAGGILRRAGRRGRELPAHLAEALSQLSRAEDGEATG